MERDTRTRDTATALAAPPPAAVMLIVVPAVAGAAAAVSTSGRLGGLSLSDRIARAAAAGGLNPVPLGEVGRRGSDRTNGSLRASNGASSGPARVVLLPANVVPLPSWLALLATTPLPPGTLCVDSSMTMVVATDDARAVLEAARRCATVEALAADLRRAFTERPWPFDAAGRFPLLAPGDDRRAELWLLRSLIKQREGFMSRHFERRISLALTRRLASTRITPNAMTLVSAAVGLGSAPFFLSSRPSWQLVGSFVLLAHSILDGCDGELARLKFLQSRRGAVLDFWGDSLVHVAVFTGLAVGWSLSAGSAWPLGVGAVAIGATLGSAATMFERTAQDRPKAVESKGARLLDNLASRDFIYALIVLSAFGWAPWFLVAVAIGGPFFLLAALWLERRGRVR